jgi:Tol biopolymer transport system component
MNKCWLAAPAAVLLTALTALFLPAATDDPPKPPKPANLDCNTAADEDEPHATSNGLTLYYTSNAKTKLDVMVSRRSGGKWLAGKLLGGYVQSPTNKKKPADDRGAFVTPDGSYPQYLYFATNKDENEEKGDNFDIYVSYRDGPSREFVPPEAVTAVDTAEDERDPWLTKDGKTLYFSRKTKDGWRVFTATRKKATGAQGFEEPSLVDELPVDFSHATLTPDGKTMYLQGPLDKGRWGLFLSTKEGKKWGKPTPLDEWNDPSGPTGDRSPSLSRDGKTLYFASDRDGGKGGLDLYSIAIADLHKK